LTSYVAGEGIALPQKGGFVESATMPEASKPKYRGLANWPIVRAPQPGAVTSQDIYSTAACDAVDVPEYRRCPHTCWPGKLFEKGLPGSEDLLNLMVL
jgi:hypothetical protein